MRLQVLMPGFHNNFLAFHQALSRLGQVELLIAETKHHTVPEGLGSRPVRRWGRLLSPLDAWRRISPEADAVLIKHLNTPDSALAFLICLLKGVRPLFYVQRVRHLDTRAYRLLLRLYLGLVKRSSAGAFSVTREGHRELRRLVGRGAYIPFCIRTEGRPVKAFAPRKRVRLLCVAAFHERKEILLLITAVKRLPEVSLTIVGHYSGPARKGYYGRVLRASRGLPVRVLRNLSQKELEKQYLDADLFVLPSRREPASYSNLEAMAYGLPVVCSDDNGTACYLRPGRNGERFRAGDARSLERALRRILFKKEGIDWERMAAYGKESRRIAEEEHSIDRAAARLRRAL